MDIYDGDGHRISTKLWAFQSREAAHRMRIATAAEALIDLTFGREPGAGPGDVWTAERWRQYLRRELDRAALMEQITK